MKINLFTLFILLLLGTRSIASLTDDDIKLNGTFVLQDTAKISHSFNYELLVSSGTYTMTVFYAPDSSTHMAVFRELSLDVFKANFIALTIKAINTVSANERETVSVKTFYQIQARLEFADDEPLTSRFILKKDSIRSSLSANSSIRYNEMLSKLYLDHSVKDLEIEIEYGALKNITLRTSSTNKDIIRDFLVFKNLFPFASSSKFDPEDLLKLRLYCQNCGGNDGIIRFVTIGDLFHVDNILENNKEDYSPYNQTFILSPTAPIKEVRKERRSKIIDVATFTDFNGFNGDNPNGLVQIEASRRINLFTKHIQLGRRRDISNYFDYDKISGDAIFVDKPSRKFVIIKLNFKESSYAKLLRNITNTRNNQLSYYRKNIPKLHNEIAALMFKYTLAVKNFSTDTKELDSQISKAQLKKEEYEEKLSELARDSVDASTIQPIKINNLIIDKKRRLVEDVSSNYNSDTTATFGRSGYYKFKLKPLRIRYINLIGYFEPTFRYAKIEKNKKVLSLSQDNYVNNEILLNVIQLQ